MRATWLALVAVNIALWLGACATTPPLTAPARPVPDLRGTWTGTWGGTPLTLFVAEQAEEAGPGAVTFGPWPLFGERLPGLSGVLTFTVRGEAVSVNCQGRLGNWNERLTLVLGSLTPNGSQIILTHVDARRLAGQGTSRASWEPQGAVELVREAGDDPGGARR